MFKKFDATSLALARLKNFKIKIENEKGDASCVLTRSKINTRTFLD